MTDLLSCLGNVQVTLLVVDTEGLQGNTDRDLCILSLSLLLR